MNYLHKMVITSDHLILSVRPFHVLTIQKRDVNFTMACFWLIGLSSCLPFFFLSYDSLFSVYYQYVFLTFDAILLVLLIVTYSFIPLRLRRNRRKLSSDSTHAQILYTADRNMADVNLTTQEQKSNVMVTLKARVEALKMNSRGKIKTVLATNGDTEEVTAPRSGSTLTSVSVDRSGMSGATSMRGYHVTTISIISSCFFFVIVPDVLYWFAFVRHLLVSTELQRLKSAIEIMWNLDMLCVPLAYIFLKKGVRLAAAEGIRKISRGGPAKDSRAV